MRSSVECVSEWSAALASQDKDAIDDLLHPDFKLFEPDGLSYGGVYEGRAGWWAFWDIFLATWTDLSISDQVILPGVGDDDCAIKMNLGGRSIKTGKSFQTTLMEYWRFKDGRILEMHPHYRDTRYLAATEGAL